MYCTDISCQRLRVGNEEYSSADLPLIRERYLTETDEALRDLYHFLVEWFDESSSCMTVQTSGSTGIPKEMSVSKKKMMNSAVMTCRFLGLKKDDKALLCMNLRYIGAKMVVVRSLVAGMRLVLRKASSHPFADISEKIDFAAIVPMQLRNTLDVPYEKETLSTCSCVIVGGGPVDESLCSMLEGLECKLYSTYGMTETLSHIALRRLNGTVHSSCSDTPSDKSSDTPFGYVPFEGVEISITDNGTLAIKAPSLFDGILKTNDVAEILDDGSFIIKGRTDNIVNSGGIKIQIETVEKRLSEVICTPFAITSVPDQLLGESLVLLVDKGFVLPSDCISFDDFIEKLRELLPKYHAPRKVLILDAIPTVGNGKTDRVLCKRLAAEKH